MRCKPLISNDPILVQLKKFPRDINANGMSFIRGSQLLALVAHHLKAPLKRGFLVSGSRTRRVSCDVVGRRTLDCY